MVLLPPILGQRSISLRAPITIDCFKEWTRLLPASKYQDPYTHQFINCLDEVLIWCTVHPEYIWPSSFVCNKPPFLIVWSCNKYISYILYFILIEKMATKLGSVLPWAKLFMLWKFTTTWSRKKLKLLYFNFILITQFHSYMDDYQ